MHRTQQQGLQGAPGIGLLPGFQITEEGVALPLGEEIHQSGALLPFPQPGKPPGHLHGRNARQAVFCELHLAHILGQGMVAGHQSQPGLGTDALQAAKAVHVTFQRHQSRIHRHAAVAKLLGQHIAAAVGAQLGGCLAAGGQNHPVSEKAPAVGGFHGKFALISANGGNGASALHVDLGPLQGQQKHVQHHGGLLAVWIDPAFLLFLAQKAQLAEKVQHLPGRHILQRLPQKALVIAVKMARPGVHIGEVAPAVAGGQDLFAHPVQSLQQGDLLSGEGFRGSQRRRETGRTAADDEDLCHNCLIHLSA